MNSMDRCMICYLERGNLFFSECGHVVSCNSCFIKWRDYCYGAYINAIAQYQNGVNEREHQNEPNQRTAALDSDYIPLRFVLECPVCRRQHSEHEIHFGIDN